MTEAEKLLKIQQCMEEYEKRFHLKLAQMPRYSPWLPEERETIRQKAFELLGMKEEWIPEIKMELVRILPYDGYTVEQYRFTSWPGVMGTAHLYKPNGWEEKKNPVILHCCGHTIENKHGPKYQAVSRRLARQGAIVLMADNMGQGERVPMGHSHVEIPFACGITFQGMLAMESMGLLRWLAAQPYADPERVGVTGISGGGALSMLVGAFSPEAKAILSHGYPSSFESFLRKDKVHCACNILPGMLGKMEMWHILSLCAPRRLRIMQGKGDELFPYEVFCDTARRLKAVYTAMGCPEQMDYADPPGPHGWDWQRRYEVGKFFAEVFDLLPPDEAEDDMVETIPLDVRCYDAYPEHALTTDDAARLITGKDVPDDTHLWDVFPPQVDMTEIGDMPCRHAGGKQKTYRHLFAQYEASLKD